MESLAVYIAPRETALPENARPWIANGKRLPERDGLLRGVAVLPLKTRAYENL
jgi:hypothetical protein